MSGETIRTIRRADPLYPERLRSYERMPERLYVLGCLPDPEKKSVAIVGARACSAYGKAETLRFSRTLARHGVQIISGMAHGIDSWAHIGALDAGGSTFAVFGCGVDVCYPPSHHALYARILSGEAASFLNSIRARGPGPTIFLCATASSARWPISFLLWRREESPVP